MKSMRSVMAMGALCCCLLVSAFPIVSAASTTTTSSTSSYTVNVVNSPTLGSFLVNASGFTLYYFAPDHRGNATSPPVSTCGTALDCLQVWPIFYAAKITVPAGLNASDFTTFTRSDGSLQTAYKGWPLYYYVGDKSAGQTTGQDTNGSGGYWYVAAVSGDLTGSLGTTSTTTSTTPTPEFPVGALSGILLAIVAVAALLAGRKFRSTPAVGASGGRP